MTSGVVGFAGSAPQGQADQPSRDTAAASVPLTADPVALAVADAVAESRGQRVSRSLQRFELDIEAIEGAKAIDERVVAKAEEDAAEAARLEAERKAKAEAARKAAAKKKAAAARAAAAPRWVMPVSGARMSASFGEGGGLWANRHTGQDFAAPSGTPVRAVGDGTIVSAGWDGAFGRKIVIRHRDGTQTWYCHLSSFTRTSGTVKAGQQIGRVGSTGNTTGPHLHFEVHPGGGDPINPLSWLRART
ncbi:MAG TPA: M23 family metallopeptidase [Actinomycetes bacterium]|nr:M23 family metallopeptidase [Actinomycetes bacterium]